MVRLTSELICKGTVGYTKKRKEETSQQYLRRLTHVYLEDKNIDDSGEDLALCRNLTVLYLYDNQLKHIPHLGMNQNLNHLYLQNNQISRIENLSPLYRLTKLYVGSNNLTVIEGLENLHSLQELHVESQRLPPGEKLLFDPRSLKGISKSLQVLNISGNNIDSLTDLECLTQLNHLTASDNLLNDMKELAHVMSLWPFLWHLDLLGNPLCHKAKYRDRVIVMTQRLGVLDGKEVTEMARKFLQNWQANKDARKLRSEEMNRKGDAEGSELPPVHGLTRHASIPGSIPAYVMPGLPRKQFDEIIARNATSDGAVTTGNKSAPAHVHANIGSGILKSKLPDIFNRTSTYLFEPVLDIPIKS